MEEFNLVDETVELLLAKKGTDLKILDLRELTAIADYFVICSADSDIQVKALADNVNKELSKRGIKCYHKEGFQALNWVILDYFDVVVHIFHKDARYYYNLEKLWGDAPVKQIDDDQ